MKHIKLRLRNDSHNYKLIKDFSYERHYCAHCSTNEIRIASVVDSTSLDGKHSVRYIYRVAITGDKEFLEQLINDIENIDTAYDLEECFHHYKSHITPLDPVYDFSNKEFPEQFKRKENNHESH